MELAYIRAELNHAEKNTRTMTVKRMCLFIPASRQIGYAGYLSFLSTVPVQVSADQGPPIYIGLIGLRVGYAGTSIKEGAQLVADLISDALSNDKGMGMEINIIWLNLLKSTNTRSRF